MVELKANRALQINLCGLHKELEALHCPFQNKTLNNNFRTDQLVIQMPHTCHILATPVGDHFQSFFKDMFLSVSFFMTLATAISKSSWVTCTRRSRNANMPASVQTAYMPPPIQIFSLTK
jgi:hypothetical protein